MSKKDANQLLIEAKQELEAAREAARLKLHLLSMDARGKWDDLEKKFQGLQADLSETGEKVGETSAAAARDLAHSIRKFVEKHV